MISNRTRAAFRPNCTPLSSITIINHGLGFTLISRNFLCRGGFSLPVNLYSTPFESVFNRRSRQRTTLRYLPSFIPKKRQLFIHKVFISSRRKVFFKTSLALQRRRSVSNVGRGLILHCHCVVLWHKQTSFKASQSQLRFVTLHQSVVQAVLFHGAS